VERSSINLEEEAQLGGAEMDYDPPTYFVIFQG
jgi:hypothetical protein